MNNLEYLEATSYIITILGLPVAIYVYWKEQRDVKRARLYDVYDALDDKYIELQTLCLEYPDLDIFDTPFSEKATLDEKQLKQEEAILLIRFSIFERAYLMYKKNNQDDRKCQWNGWESEIKQWLKRDNFKRACDQHKSQFDSDFVSFIDKFS